MKIVALIACVFLLGPVSAGTKYNLPVANLQRFEIGGFVEDFLNAFFHDLSYYDPMHIDEFYIRFLWFKAGFKNFHLEGFSNVDVNISIDVAGLTKIQCSMGLSKLFGSVESYESNFPFVYGNGTAGLDINNANIEFAVDFDLFNGFSPSSIVTSIGSANVFVTGVLNDEALSKEISDNITNYLNVVVNSPEFHAMLEEYVDSFLSIFMREMIQMRK